LASRKLPRGFAAAVALLSPGSLPAGAIAQGAPQAETSSYPGATAGSAQSLTTPATAANAVSQVPAAVQEVRRQVLKAPVNSFYFQQMDALFETRQVPRSGPVWYLPRSDCKLEFSYSWAGETFGAEEFLDRTFTNALVVLKDGRIVSEIYRNRSGPATRFMSWSAAKSFTSTLVGLALAEGKIKSLDDPVTQYLPELRRGGYNGVTIRQVLQMRSGVAYEERYDGSPGLASDNHELALIQNVRRFAEPAATIGRANPPGSVFAYNTLDTTVLGLLVEKVTDRPLAYYMAEHLWEPLGAEANGYFIMDGPPGAGREFAGAGFNATARDYARFGQMILDGGKANGRQIISPAWIAEATVPAGSEGPEGGYGFQWWTVPGSNAFYALGLEGQYIFVDPDTRTVIVKLSYFPPERADLYGEAVAGSSLS
jgi:CubicO group peptidase (beta-lactamase class C family)